MNSAISEAVISRLSDHIISRMGLYFPRERWAELENKITSASNSLGFADTASCIEWVLSSRTDQRQLEILANCLTNGETYFFRENKSLAALTARAIPDIIKAHQKTEKSIRIWSAGCSTGEEPYTLAMIVSGMPELLGWKINILGTDINQKVLAVAEEGLYEEWSFRGVDAETRSRYFTKEANGGYRVLPEIKKLVSFMHLNLIDDVYPSLINNTNALDLILCRNVLMYFTPQNVVKIIGKFQKALVAEGWLLVSPVEISIVDQALFTPLYLSGAVLHKKKTAAVAPPAGTGIKPPAALTVKTPKTAAKKTSLNFEEMYQAAMQYYRDADYDRAIQAFSGLSGLEPADIRIFQFLSRSFANKGMLPDAEKWCLQAISANKINPASLYLLALIRIEQQRIGEAIIILRQALYLEPDFVVAHYTLANLYHRGGKETETERHLRIALQILQTVQAGTELPESEGISAGKMSEMIASINAQRINNGNHYAF